MSAPTELLDMDTVVVDAECALTLPPVLAIRRQLLAFAVEDDAVHIACVEPSDRSGLDAASRHFGRAIVAEAAEPESLRRAIERVYGDIPAGHTTGTRLRTLDLRSVSIDTDGDTAIQLVDDLIRAARLARASDLHLDPSPDGLRVRLRVDGVIEPGRALPMSVHSAIVGRIKVLGGLDIAERRAPQDGRFRHAVGAGSRRREIDIRVATLPTRHGERLTLRLLDGEASAQTLAGLGMGATTRAAFERAIAQPHGLVLLNGPTGAGKTTTLYAALTALVDSKPLNVLTVEDPIEYELDGVAQVEITRGDQVSFHRALRHLLRHDPDALMIGEIRDAESADVAIKAALTGHLVLSTLHANSAPGAITRLLDLGVERYLIAATLRLTVAQRLVRRLCTHQRVRRPLGAAEAGALGDPTLAGREVDDAVGCRYCAQRGYVGRLGLFEALELDGGWAERISAGDDEPALLARAREQGLPTLRDAARDAVLAGRTSPSEAVAAIAAW